MYKFDYNGNLILDPEQYQAGGYILPQMVNGQNTLQSPSSAGLFDAIQNTTNSDWNRYVQGSQLGMQSAAQGRNMIDSIYDRKYKSQQQEKLIKQYDLQNKRFELELLKEKQKAITEVLAVDDNLFLDGDQQDFQKQMETDKMDDNSLNTSLSSSDINTIYDNLNKRKTYVTKFKKYYDRKNAYIKGTAELTKLDDDYKRINEAAEKGYLNIDDARAFTDAQTQIHSKLNRMLNDSSYDIRNDQEYNSLMNNYINANKSFINEIDYKQYWDTQKQLQQSNILNKQAQAELDKAKAEVALDRLPSQIALEKAKTDEIIQTLPYELDKLKISNALTKKEHDILSKEWDIFEKTYPNPTLEQLQNFKSKVSGKVSNDAISSIDELLARKLQSEGASVEDIISAKQRANKSTSQSNINYSSDGKGIINADKSIDYGSLTVDKDGVTPISVTIKGETFTVNSTDENKGKVVGVPDATLTVVNGKGYLKLKGGNNENRNWIYDKYGLKYGKTWINDDLKNFPSYQKAPKGSFFDAGYLYIPQDENNQTTVPTTPSNPTPAPKGKKFG